MSTEPMNMWEMSQKLNLAQIPSFVKAKYILLSMTPPNGKTIRDGIVVRLAMLSYEGDNGSIELVEVTKDPGGYTVSLPKGKRGILATKFRGPKSWYRFFNNVEQKFYQWGKNDPKTGVNSNLALPYVKELLAKENPDWEEFDVIERDAKIDAYYKNKYMEALAKDFNLDVEVDKTNLPKVGMVTDFYRRSTPPKEGERFSNITVTKFAPREGKETISGEYNMVDEEIPAAILDKLTRRENTSFNPDDITKSEDSQDDEDFDLAA